MIKEVAKKVISEFPMINELSTLSPIPNFKTWFLEKIKQGTYNLLSLISFKIALIDLTFFKNPLALKIWLNF